MLDRLERFWREIVESFLAPAPRPASAPPIGTVRITVAPSNVVITRFHTSEASPR